MARILHLSAADQDGGAARAAYRIHAGLRRIGVDSRMLVGNKTGDDPTVAAASNSPIGKFFAFVRPAVDAFPVRVWYQPKRRPYFFADWVPDGLTGHPAFNDADLVQLHWVSAGFLKPETLLSLKRPIVWRLSDQWAFTGGCHYSGTCVRYEQQCGICPQLESSKEHDLSFRAWERKQKVYSQLDLTVVSPSNWLAGLARKSSLFGQVPVRVIHNGIDTEVFRPIEKSTARALLRLPQDRPLIAFGAVHAVDDARKGFRELQTALGLLAADLTTKSGGGKTTVGALPELLVFGSSRAPAGVTLPLPTHFLGRLHDDLTIALAYSAADVFVAPSLEENFSSTVLESVACGTPVAAFDLGGMPDLVQHQENGWLAAAVDPQDLARGIGWILEEPARRAALGQTARARALERFSLERQCGRYRELYNELLDPQRKAPK